MLPGQMKCPSCGLELKTDFPLGRFDRLDDAQNEFLLAFLRNRGNLKGVQAELHLSYPVAKRKLEQLLIQLDLAAQAPVQQPSERKIDVKQWFSHHAGAQASQLVKLKLEENGGRAIVHTIQGLPCEICAQPDGISFTSDKLPIHPPYRYTVFDVIVDLLLANGGRAKKGNGRNYKLGEPPCSETTVVGAIAKNYAGKSAGDSVFDPVFVLAAVLDWAGIAANQRGELVLTASYLSKL